MIAKPYDPTLKTLVEIEPESWPVLLGYRKAPTEVIDADIATVSGAADKVLRVAGAPAYLLPWSSSPAMTRQRCRARC
ncbi:MAG: hypothetical protein ACYC3I_19510 [Gemmataceae bacterium]